jgi:hypothetical protein
MVEVAAVAVVQGVTVVVFSTVGEVMADTTGIRETMVLLLMETEATDARKKEMERDVVGMLVDPAVEEIQVTLVGTLTVTVEQVTERSLNVMELDVTTGEQVRMKFLR